MTSLKDEALTAAVYKAVLDAIGSQFAAVRGVLSEELVNARKVHGVRSIDVELPDGTHVATVTLRQPKESIRVDQAGFTAWVHKNHPDEIVPAVRSSFQTAVTGRLLIVGDDVINMETSEVVDWAHVVPAGEPSEFAIRFTGPSGKVGREAIAAAWQEGRLDGYAPGPRAIEAGP